MKNVALCVGICVCVWHVCVCTRFVSDVLCSISDVFCAIADVYLSWRLLQHCQMYVCRDVFCSIVRCVFVMVYSKPLQIWHILSHCLICICCVSRCCCQCWWTSSVILATKLPLTLHICSLDSVNSQPSCLFPLTVINWCTARVMYSACRKNVWEF